METFTAFFLFVVMVYSNSPGGEPPFFEQAFSFAEFDLPRCAERVHQLQANPVQFVRAATGRKPTQVLTVRFFDGWYCTPMIVTK